MKKVLWVNPSFLDYRIPLYDELNKLYQNNFHLIYSKQRVPQRCIDKIESVLKGNALGLLTEKNVSIGKKDGFANSGISLPFPKGLYRLIKSVKADIVIFDPPRKGLDKKSINNILQIKPKKLVYISCNPATLIRDLKMFEEQYEIKTIIPVDMFPWTSHIECVSLLCLKKGLS